MASVMGSGMSSPTAPTAAGITPGANAARPARSVLSSDQLLVKANPSTSDRQASVGIGPPDRWPAGPPQVGERPPAALIQAQQAQVRPEWRTHLPSRRGRDPY